MIVAAKEKAKKEAAPGPVMVSIHDLKFDMGTQQRVELDRNQVEDIRAAYERGEPVPPVEVYDTEAGLLPTDGFHRIDGRLQAGFEDIEAIVIPGSVLDAREASCRANATAIVPRCPQTKRNAVKTLLDVWEARQAGKPESERTRPTDGWLCQMARVHNRVVKDAVKEYYADRDAAEPAIREKKSGRVIPAKVAVDGGTPDKYTNSQRSTGTLNENTPSATIPTYADSFDDPEPDPVKAEPAKVSTQSDDREWLEGLKRDGKADVRARLTEEKRRIFDLHALAYKADREDPSYKAWAVRAKSRIGERKTGGLEGGYAARVRAFVVLTLHPADWSLCYECKGHGVKDGRPCEGRGCGGNGFVVS